MITIKNSDNLSWSEMLSCIKRPEMKNIQSIQTTVRKIIKTVQDEGDAALLKFTQEFDGISLKSMQIATATIDSATIANDEYDAIKLAIQTISQYHQANLPQTQAVSTAPGVTIRSIYRPIQRVGLYVPGGNTPLISSLLMQAIPAAIAGCPIKIICTPPNRQGEIDTRLLMAARLCGINTIYAIGGAQAIAAMAYGTETIPKVDKIFGPGNSYVTEAKKQVSIDSQGSGIDMPAGPSEVMIIADDAANPDFVAADLLAQAEHGVDSQVILLCTSEQFANRVNEKISQQFEQRQRKEIILKSLANSLILVMKNLEQSQDLINSYAPEHLIVNRSDADKWVKNINAAGTIFLGPWGAETLGDYITGSNHVLPTYGYARSHSGLNTSDFLTKITVQSITQEGILSLGQAAITLARIEGLDAHANAVELRLSQLEY